MAQNNPDDVLLKNLEDKPNGPWRAIILVIVITLIAIWLVPGEEKAPEPIQQPMSGTATTPTPIIAETDAGAESGSHTDAPAGTTPVQTTPSPAADEPTSAAQPDATGQTTGDTPPDAATSQPEQNQAAHRPPEAEQQQPIPTVVKPGDAAPPGTSARELIKQLDAGKAADLDRAVAQADQHLAQGNDEDAYLLYFYAARHGHEKAAFTLGQQADPAHHQANGLFPQADERQALKWYQRAAQAGHPAAKTALDQLHAALKSAADQGNERAQRLLLQWN